MKVPISLAIPWPNFSEKILDTEPENLLEKLRNRVEPIQSIKCAGKKNKINFPDEFAATTAESPYIIYSNNEKNGEFAGLYKAKR